MSQYVLAGVGTMDTSAISSNGQGTNATVTWYKTPIQNKKANIVLIKFSSALEAGLTIIACLQPFSSVSSNIGVMTSANVPVSETYGGSSQPVMSTETNAAVYGVFPKGSQQIEAAKLGTDSYIAYFNNNSSPVTPSGVRTFQIWMNVN